MCVCVCVEGETKIVLRLSTLIEYCGTSNEDKVSTDYYPYWLIYIIMPNKTVYSCMCAHCVLIYIMFNIRRIVATIASRLNWN